MSNQKLLSLYGLKWNPFAGDVPVEGLLATPPIEHFAWRVEQLVLDGGFALISGDPGTGKSVALRILADRLGRLREAAIGILSRPQSDVPDFYRELGEIFGVKLSPHNRWGGFKVLRERWKSHVESSLLRPVLLIDEAQAMAPSVLSELRILSSAHFDTQHYLTVVLAGDGRLIELFRHDDLVPLASRIHTRLTLDYAPRQDLKALLAHAMNQAGNSNLMTPALMDTLAEHAAGNCRVLMSMAGELLVEGMSRERAQLDEKLYLEIFDVNAIRREPQRREKRCDREWFTEQRWPAGHSGRRDP